MAKESSINTAVQQSNAFPTVERKISRCTNPRFAMKNNEGQVIDQYFKGTLAVSFSINKVGNRQVTVTLGGEIMTPNWGHKGAQHAIFLTEADGTTEKWSAEFHSLLNSNPKCPVKCRTMDENKHPLEHAMYLCNPPEGWGKAKIADLRQYEVEFADLVDDVGLLQLICDSFVGETFTCTVVPKDKTQGFFINRYSKWLNGEELAEVHEKKQAKIQGASLLSPEELAALAANHSVRPAV